MLGDSKSKMNWQETSVMQYFDCDKAFHLTWFILLHKSLLGVVTSVPIPKKNQPASSNCGTKMEAEIKTP